MARTRLLALWTPPALVAASLAALSAVPAGSPGPLEALGVLARLALGLFASLFLIAWFAAPTASLAAGQAAGPALRRPAVLRVALTIALFQSLALMLTLVPGLLAAYVNPLMAQIFLVVGTIAGAAAAVGLFARWMFAPALAWEGLAATAALDASRAEAKRRRTFGFALGLSVLLALAALLGGGLSLAVTAHPVLQVLARALPLAPALAFANHAIAQRHQQGAPSAPGAPTLALTRRPSRCPRCGALADAPVTGSGEVACPGCGLRAVLR